MESFTLVIFGITSNLAQIKLIPALYDITEKGLLPKTTKIIGIARSPKSKAEFRSYIRSTLTPENRHHKHPIKADIFQKLCSMMEYLPGQADDSKLYQALKQQLKSPKQNVMFYLATYPELYQVIFASLHKNHLNRQKNGWVRIMIEKPIGTDLQSAKRLNQLLFKYFTEDQIYRLDHYLGKETLQNILTFRFGNGLFEPLMNKDYIDHIQVTALEDFGIGKRGGYYDTVGSLRDVGQNHLLQMLTFATMDAPATFSNEDITKQRLKILESLKPLSNHVVFGQYQGYINEPNVNPKSITDTFFALKTSIKNDRLKNVPIYIRAGKKLAQSVTEVAIVFKNPIKELFKHLESGNEPNVLIYRIQPNEGIVLQILTKRPGHKLDLEPNYMQFCYPTTTHPHYLPDAYERLICDAIRGDQTFFCDSEEVEAAWAFVDDYISKRGEPIIYKPGSWGPKEADKLTQKDARSWLEPSMQFCMI